MTGYTFIFTSCLKRRTRSSWSSDVYRLCLTSVIRYSPPYYYCWWPIRWRGAAFQNCHLKKRLVGNSQPLTGVL